MLYVVGTPIGNLEDLSLRQARAISQAEIILSEDTRSTGILLQKIKVLFPSILDTSHSPRLISYYREKEFEKLPEIIELLEADRDLVLISQAGMPLISDPGLLLIQTAIKRDIPFTVIPGPTAATTALVYSGFNPEFSMFIGFLPKKSSHLKKLLAKLYEIKKLIPEASFILYESGHRVIETLTVIHDIFPENKVVIARELTKKFEEIIRGSATDLIQRNYKGELTLVLT